MNEHNILDAPTTTVDKKKYFRGFKVYVPTMFFFALLPTIIMNTFSPGGFTEFMNFPDDSFAYITVFGMFGIAGILFLLILYRLFQYWRAKKRAN